MNDGGRYDLGLVAHKYKKEKVNHNHFVEDDVAVKKLEKNEVNEEIIFLDKFLERLRGYHCGCHKQLEQMILNRKKRINQRSWNKKW